MLLQPLELPPAPEKVVLKVLKDTLSKVEVTRGADGWPSFRDLAIHLLTTDVAVVGKPTGGSEEKKVKRANRLREILTRADQSYDVDGAPAARSSCPLLTLRLLADASMHAPPLSEDFDALASKVIDTLGKPWWDNPEVRDAEPPGAKAVPQQPSPKIIATPIIDKIGRDVKVLPHLQKQPGLDKGEGPKRVLEFLTDVYDEGMTMHEFTVHVTPEMIKAGAMDMKPVHLNALLAAHARLTNLLNSGTSAPKAPPVPSGLGLLKDGDHSDSSDEPAAPLGSKKKKHPSGSDGGKNSKKGKASDGEKPLHGAALYWAAPDKALSRGSTGAHGALFQQMRKIPHTQLALAGVCPPPAACMRVVHLDVCAPAQVPSGSRWDHRRRSSLKR